MPRRRKDRPRSRVQKKSNTPNPAETHRVLVQFLKQESAGDLALVLQAYPEQRTAELSRNVYHEHPTLHDCLRELDQVYRRKFAHETEEAYVASMLKRGYWVFGGVSKEVDAVSAKREDRHTVAAAPC